MAPNETPPPGGAPTAALLRIAVALLVGYGIALVTLFVVGDNSAVSETVWSRYIYLLGGLQAVVFTAVGWLFGREVNRGQAEQAAQAVEEASDAKKKGEGLRQAILVATGTEVQEAVGSPMAALRMRAQETHF